MRSALCALLFIAAAASVRAQDATVSGVETQQRENLLLKKQVELANADAFYLLIDLKTRTVSMLLHGVALGRYPILQVEVAERRVAWVSRSSEEDWQGRIFLKGNLVPPRERDRVELKAPPPGTDPSAEQPYVPPPPEEAFPVPPRYGIRFEGGVYVEVRPSGGDSEPGFGDRMRHWWEDVKEALRSQPTDRVRVRVTLKGEDGNAIYRSLPPNASLLVLPAQM